MSRTFAAAAPGLPSLRFAGLPELEGTALRLHVAPFVTARWPSGNRGYALLSLCPGDDPDEPAALVRLPLAQADALAKACAAFNVIMDAAERDAKDTHSVSTPAAAHSKTELVRQAGTRRAGPIDLPQPVASGAAPRAQALVTAAAQLVVLAGILPAVMARCLGLI